MQKEKGLEFILTALGNLLGELQKYKMGGSYRPDHAFSAFLTYWALGALWEWREELQDNDDDFGSYSVGNRTQFLSETAFHVSYIPTNCCTQYHIKVVRDCLRPDWNWINDLVPILAAATC